MLSTIKSKLPTKYKTTIVNMIKIADLLSLRIRLYFEYKYNSINCLEYTCNICGNKVKSITNRIKSRETPSCPFCGSNKRFRSIIHALQNELLRNPDKPLTQQPKTKNIKGIGLSDSHIYARYLEALFDYENTYYHKDPKLDITKKQLLRHEAYDFIIASDVFEHVPQPVQTAFYNLNYMLKPGGICIFSVPYNNEGETKEHFPELFQFELIKDNKTFVLKNVTKEGVKQQFSELTFHGGPGSTLEMRVFSMPALLKHFQQADFIDVQILNENCIKSGIIFSTNEDSLVWVVRKARLNNI